MASRRHTRSASPRSKRRAARAQRSLDNQLEEEWGRQQDAYNHPNANNSSEEDSDLEDIFLPKRRRRRHRSELPRYDARPLLFEVEEGL